MDLKEKNELYLAKKNEYLNIFKDVFILTKIQIDNITSIVIEENTVFEEILDNIVYLSNEIFWLIRGGYSEGAFARFRLLHEFIVKFEIMYFDESREILINRYNLNNSLINIKEARFDRGSEEYLEIISEIREEATRNGLKNEFYDLLHRDFIDRNWWFETVCGKTCDNIGFRDFELKLTEIKNQLMDTNDISDNIIYKYTSNKVHGYSIDELRKFHRVFTIGKEMDDKLYLDDIIDILEIFTIELAEFIGFIFLGEDFCENLLDSADKIIDKINELKKIYCNEDE